MEQNGDSIQHIIDRQFEQKPCSPSFKNFSQQGHWGGRRNWMRVDRIFMSPEMTPPAYGRGLASQNGRSDES